VIIGASRPEQPADNFAAADRLLTAHEVAELDAQAPRPPLYPDPRWLTSGH
jgi:aryl-alcohol dehydrogenase-like predicted oxidoreductase